jgi:hypothetical protein
MLLPKALSLPQDVPEILHCHWYSSRSLLPWNYYTSVETKKNMNVISCYLQRIYLKLVILANLLKNSFYPISNIIPQYPLSIFRCPYQMIFRIVYRMTGSLQFHALTITHFSLPSAGELFIPVYKTGYSSSNFYVKKDLELIPFLTLVSLA